MSGWLTELTHSMGLACEESAGYHTRPFQRNGTVTISTREIITMLSLSHRLFRHPEARELI